MAIRKSVWRKLKGFPEQFSRNEDYVFARRIKQEGYRIAFAPKAIVYWIPSETIIEAMRMFARDARGDAEAGLIRAKVMLLFARYISFIVLLIFVLKLSKGYLLLFGVLMAYIIWSVDKNYHYMPGFRSILIFPLLQIIADASVIYGTLRGFVSRCLLFFSDKRFYRVIK
jgi:GT2 family glycosyltransferase